MIFFNINSDHILFRLDWPNMQGFRDMILPRPPLASVASLKSVCSETARTCQRFAPYTSTAYVGSLRKIFNFATIRIKILPEPNSDAWRVFVNEHYLYHLSNPEKSDGDGDKEFDTMRVEWTQIVYVYKNLKQKRIIPSNINIPTMRMPKVPNEERTGDVLDSVEATLWPLTDVNDLWPKTYLIDKGINFTTDEFLATLQSDIEKRTQAILSACEDYWDKVVECQLIGENLIASISFEQIEAVLASGNFYTGRRYIADPANPTGAAWFLAMINYYFLTTDELSSISYNAMSKIPFFEPFCRNGYMKAKMDSKLREIAGEFCAPNLDINETLNRLLGHVSARDCGAAAAILIAENPKFNPHPLRSADYLSDDDKPRHYYNSKLGQLMWSVSKPRARSRKTSALPPRSLKIYTAVVKATMKARIRLMLAGDINYRKLFLTSSIKWVGLSSNLDQILTTSVGVSLYQAIEPALRSGDVPRKVFSLRRIRGSQGLISFLKEGTYQAAANTLGNSIAVVIARYIPDWLKYRWNVRILRTFQTKLIILATKGRPWHFAATDFMTVSQLFNFIIREASASLTSDPVSMDLKRYAAELTEDAANHLIQHLVNHKMILKLDPVSLAAVFLFAEMFNSDSGQRYEDPDTGLTENSILTLAKLLHSTYEITRDQSTTSPIVNNIAGLSVPYFQEVYAEALNLKSELAKKTLNAHIMVK